MTDELVKTRLIALADAIQQIVSSSLLDDFAAVHLIEQGLTSGKLKTSARDLRETAHKADVSNAGRKGFSASAPLKPIEKSFWRPGARFSTGVFEELEFGSPVSVAMPEPPDFEIEDLHISAADLRRWILTEGSAAISPSLRGRSPKEQAWAFMIVLLIEETRISGLTQSKFPQPQDLLKLLHDEWDEREDNPNSRKAKHDPSVLDDRTIKAVIEDVWESIVRGS
jgi:hypothetical protein